MRITEGITLIEGAGANSNCYLVECASGMNVLVDAGMPENFGRIRAHVKGIDVIVNTHCHYDHAGADGLLKREFGAKVAAHELDAPYISSGDAKYTCASLFGKAFEKVKVDLVLKDGMALSGTGLEVVHTPGHTRGGICLYERKRRVLFSGDTLFAHGGVGRTDLPGGDFGALAASLEKISKLDVEMILPGHGGCVLSDGSDYIKRVLEEMNF